MTRLTLAMRAVYELGPRQLFWYARYQLGLRTGYYRWWTVNKRQRSAISDQPAIRFVPVLDFPERDELAAVLGGEVVEALAQADEVVAGKVRLFGGPPVTLKLVLPGPLAPWPDYETGKADLPGEDIKWIWEPARFGWVFTLGRAYYLSRDERYPAAFWQAAEQFLESNPPYQGPHWISAQEVAVRLMAFAFAGQVFSDSPHTTSIRGMRLCQAVVQHAERIILTLAYARAQDNNHLLSEAAGLYTAGCMLPEEPGARTWLSLGWRLFHQGLRRQVAADGAYVQHSTNYHRLMLGLALWMRALAQQRGASFPVLSQTKLAAATHWLLALLDPQSGRVPNLGPNDGANLFPFTNGSFNDFRPVLQAATQAFLGEAVMAPGAWDELGLWFGIKAAPIKPAPHQSDSRPRNIGVFNQHYSGTPHVLRHPTRSSWAYLRIVRFSERPGHADQLHLDLWWRGINLAQDAGTYLYNAAPPWDNALVSTMVHNTVSLNGQEQMRRAGRFLFLEWAQAQVLTGERAADGAWQSLVARQDGYHCLGVWHERRVTVEVERGWCVEDWIQPGRAIHGLRAADRNQTPVSILARVHWLLPDWPWELVLNEGKETRAKRFCLHSPFGELELELKAGVGVEMLTAQIVRAGEILFGEGEVSPAWGWASPSYGYKEPALAVILEGRGTPPLSLTSRWILPTEVSTPQ